MGQRLYAIATEAGETVLWLKSASDSLTVVRGVQLLPGAPVGINLYRLGGWVPAVTLRVRRWSGGTGAGTTYTPRPLHRGDAAFGGNARASVTGGSAGITAWRAMAGIGQVGRLAWAPAIDADPRMGALTLSPGGELVIELVQPLDLESQAFGYTPTLLVVVEELGG